MFYIIEIHIKRFQKSVGPSVRQSVRPSLCLLVCKAKKNTYSSFITNNRIIIRISDERAWHPLQENEAIFKKN